MGNIQLVKDICGPDRSLGSVFESWFERYPSFRLFAERYKGKIRKKVREAQGTGVDQEALMDVMYELQTARSLASSETFTAVEYEKHGIGKTGAPDFTVRTAGGTTFNVEAKRIREGPCEVRLARWKRQIQESVERIPSDLAVSVQVLGDKQGRPSCSLDKLEQATPGIIAFIQDQNAAHLRSGDILVGSSAPAMPVPGAERQVEVELHRPPHKVSWHLDWYGASCPVFTTYKEYRKFGDLIVDCLGQMIHGEINVLAISSASITHRDGDFGEALAALAQVLAEGNDCFFTRKGFSGASDFLQQMGKLSGVLFRSAWVPLPPDGSSGESGTLWVNRDADEASRLPPDVEHALRTM